MNIGSICIRVTNDLLFISIIRERTISRLYSPLISSNNRCSAAIVKDFEQKYLVIPAIYNIKPTIWILL
jgi:hypothetical protein